MDCQCSYESYVHSTQSQVRAGAPSVVDYAHMTGRPPTPKATRHLDYHVEDIPLTVLAGHRAMPGAPDFRFTKPHDLRPPHSETVDAHARVLAVDAAEAFVRRAMHAFDMSHYLPHGDPTLHGDGGDRELTAWVDYGRRSLGARRRVQALDLAKQLGRYEASRADPRCAPPATGDIDAGVYRVRLEPVMRSAPATNFGAAREVERQLLAGAAPPARDQDAGNVLFLRPDPAPGWKPKTEAQPGKQPFGRRQVRWADSEDAGPSLLLHHSHDDLARLRARATLPNAPAATFGKGFKEAEVFRPYDLAPIRILQPDPSQPVKPQPVHSSLASHMKTALAGGQPNPDRLVELVQQKGVLDPQVQQLKRRDRVWKRVAARLETLQVDAVDQALKQQPRQWPQQQGSPARPWQGARAAAEAGQAAIAAAGAAAAGYRQRERAREAGNAVKYPLGLKDAGAARPVPAPWEPQRHPNETAAAVLRGPARPAPGIRGLLARARADVMVRSQGLLVGSQAVPDVKQRDQLVVQGVQVGSVRTVQPTLPPVRVLRSPRAAAPVLAAPLPASNMSRVRYIYMGE